MARRPISQQLADLVLALVVLLLIGLMIAITASGLKRGPPPPIEMPDPGPSGLPASIFD